MAEPEAFDVKKALEQSTTRSSLQDLARRGVHRVRVLDEAQVSKLIGEAVDRIVSTKTNLLSPEDRAKLIDASRKELDRLMAEHQAMKDKTDLVEKDKSSLVGEVENLQNQLKAQRKLSEEQSKQRFEEGRTAAKGEIEALKKRLSLSEETRNSSASQAGDLSDRLATHKKENEDLRKRLSAAEQASSAVSLKAADLEGRIESHKRDAEDLRKRLAASEQTSNSATGKAGDLESQVQSARREAEELRKRLSAAEQASSAGSLKAADLEGQVQIQKREVEDLRRRLAAAEQASAAASSKSAEVDGRLQARNRDIEEFHRKLAAAEQGSGASGARISELEGRLKSGQAAHDAQLAQARSDLERRERDLREELARREQDIAARGASTKEAELRTKLDEMAAKNMEMADKQTKLLEDMKKSDEELFKNMTSLFTKSIESLSKKLGDIRLRAMAGGSVGAGAMGGGTGDLELRPSQATIEGLFSQELDNNLKSMQVESKTGTGSKLGSALDRLKALRGGGKPEEKK